MKDVLLINPPQMFSSTMIAAGIIPPLGLLYLAATLRDSGYDTEILDSVVENINQVNKFSHFVYTRGLNIPEIVKRVEKVKPLVVGITNLFSFAFPVVLELSKQLKMSLPKTKIILGGAHPSATAMDTLKSGFIDFVVISEGEQTLLDLLWELNKRNPDFSLIDGLGYKGENGEVVVNPKRKYIENLDSLKFPARDMIPLDKYFEAKESHGISNGPWTPIISSRGCPYECTFCTPELWGRRYRVRSAENVLAEIEECNKKYGIQEFHFEDENLTIDKKRLLIICEGIKKIDPAIKWQAPNGIRASVTDKEILRKMKETGCEHVTVAPESGSPRVLNEIIRKRQNLDDVTNVVREATRLGLATLAYFIMGLPGETKADVLTTINYAKKLAKDGLDEVVFSNYIPLPGSELFQKLKEQNKLKDINWFDLLSIADISKSVSWSDDITNQELKKFRKKGYLSFHFTKLIYHPTAVLKSIFNILTGRQRLKTERVLRTMIKRKLKILLSIKERGG